MEYLGELFKSTHVVVLGNEKGGSGKSTLAMHVIVALLERGRTVGSIDLDSRQQSLTRYLENREDWARRKRLDVPMPQHYAVTARPDLCAQSAQEIEEQEFAMFFEAVIELENSCDFIVIDTPGADTTLNRLGHSMADTLITPVNDSFVDLDVIARIDGQDFSAVKPSQYANMVETARKQRAMVDGGEIDWVVVRNRIAVSKSYNNQKVATALREIRNMLDFRLAPGMSDRVIFRELFPQGLTLFDIMDKDCDVDVTMSHLAARKEMRTLMRSLNLPMDDLDITEITKLQPEPNDIFEVSARGNAPRDERPRLHSYHI
jgi:chromosome partitioning protein